MYVAGTGEATGDGVQQEIFSLEQERMRLEVVKATEVIDTVEDGTCSPPSPPPCIRILIWFFSICIALKSGISDIIRTFGDKLSAFKVPPKTAKRLQLFVEYI